MRRLLQGTLILVLLCCAASGCGEPGYGYYGNRGYGYAPYSYGGLSILEATHRISGTTMIGRTITMAEGITRRLAVAIRAALPAAVTWEASAAGTVAVVTAAGIA